MDSRGGATTRVTNRDVARRAGVSPSVVSYVINNGPRAASPEARERVLAAIKELDYHPHAVARGLRSQRTLTVGFIASDYFPLNMFSSSYSAGILSGLAAELKANGYYLLVHPLLVGEDLGPFEPLLRSGRLDGVVVRLVDSGPASDALIQLVADAGLACVCLECPADVRFGFGWVLYDNVSGAQAAATYLVSRGHRRIAHLQGDPRFESARSRRTGYERALRDAGLSIDPQLVQGESWNPTSADAAVRHLIALADPPTSIFAANDSLAFRSIEVLHAEGRRVPEDVAVVGFDDIPLAQEMLPPMTTVRIPLAEIGRRAATRVLERIASGQSRGGETDVLRTELICRGTA